MEVFSFACAKAGLPSVDLVSQLSGVEFDGLSLAGNLVGAIAHLSIGVCWAVFYAFFFWGRLRIRPAFQGLSFAILPAALAILVVYPRARADAAPNRRRPPKPTPILFPAFASNDRCATRQPCAFWFDRRPDLPSSLGLCSRSEEPSPPHIRRARDQDARRRPNSNGFMFATGVECSYPTIDHGRWRRDEMCSTRHYQHWQHDFELAREIGITHLRYGPPLHLILTGPGQYDWNYIDPQMEELCKSGPEPIIDLCHFGLPWLGDCQP